MKRKYRITCFILMLMMITLSIAQAADAKITYLTESLSRIKMQHDNGFKNMESIGPGDPHDGWGLGQFYLQGYSDSVIEKEGNPVFLIRDGNHIYLKFLLQQDINKLNGKGDLRINEDSSGRDDPFEVNGPGFGRGGLIVIKTDKDGNSQTEVYRNYLTAVSAGSAEADIGPLGEGNYKVALDYELQSGTVFPGYNDYKIAFSFTIQNLTDFYATKAYATNGINLLHLQTYAVIAGIIFVLAFVIWFTVKRKRSGRISAVDAIYNTLQTESEDSEPGGRKALSPRNKKILIVSLLMIIAILCITLLGPFLSKPTTYLGPIQYLSEKEVNANIMLLGSSAASIVITALPGDTGTPVAHKLADLAGYLVVVLSIITLEKYFITSIGFIAGTIVIPLACICMIICVLLKHEFRKQLAEWAARLFVFGVCIALIIPLGCACGRAVDSIDKEAFDSALRTVDQATDMVDRAQLAYDEKREDTIEKSLSEVTKGIGLFKWAEDAFQRIVTAISKTLITTIIIPVLMLVAFIWAVKILTKKDYSGPAVYLAHRIASRTSAEIRGAGKTVSKKIHKGKDEE